MNSQSRRSFLKRSAAASTAIALAAPALRLRGAESPGDKLIVGVMGLGRGKDHVNALMQLTNVEIAFLCDVDSQRTGQIASQVEKKQKIAPKIVTDFRRVLDDHDVNALFIAAPNHWHAPATILACAAGKHVYVEKPGSHNAREAELMVEAARKHKRVVQMGNQRRTWPGMIEMIEKLRSGAIDERRYARCWYSNARASIGKGKLLPIPVNLDYALWQGPAPDMPYRDNVVHYNWHWRWHWGGGELANNGIHALDVARWGLGVDYPTRVTFNGGRYYYDDDQETPDTGAAVYTFGRRGITWDNSSCYARREETLPFVKFYGERGAIANVGSGYKVYDDKGKEIDSGTGPGGDKDHIQNFLDCIRNGKTPNSEIGDAQKSTLLCHLGNIAYRAGRSLEVDPKTGRIIDDTDAQKFWGRDYRPGWEPKV